MAKTANRLSFKQLSAALVTARALQVLLPNSIVAGGSCRDLFFGFQPLDVDMNLYGTSREQVREALDMTNLTYREYPNYNAEDGTDDRLMGVFKIDQVALDIVLYDVPTAGDVIRAFDFNINQFAIEPGRQGDSAKIAFLGEHHWSTLHAVRNDFTKDRADYVKAKHESLMSQVRRSPAYRFSGPFVYMADALRLAYPESVHVVE